MTQKLAAYIDSIFEHHRHVYHLADSECTYDAVFVGSSLGFVDQAFTQAEGLLLFTLKSLGIYNYQLTIIRIAYSATSNFNHWTLIPLTVRRMFVQTSQTC